MIAQVTGPCQTYPPIGNGQEGRFKLASDLGYCSNLTSSMVDLDRYLGAGVWLSSIMNVS